MKRIIICLTITIFFLGILPGCGRYKGPTRDNTDKYLEAKKLYLQGNTIAALPLLAEVTAKDKEFYQAAQLQGKIYYFSKEKEKARRIFESILKKHPAHAEAELWLIRTLTDLKETDQAEERIQRLLRYDPRDPRLLYQLAQIYQVKDDYKNALVVLKQASLYREEFAKVFMELGRIYNSFGQTKEALEELRYTMDLLPGDSLMRKPITALMEKIGE